MWLLRPTVFKFGIYNGIYFMDIFFFCKFMSCIELSLKGQIKVANIIIVFKHADNAMTELNVSIAVLKQVSIMRTLSLLSSTDKT